MNRRILLPVFGLVAALLVVLIGYEIFAPADAGETAAPAAGIVAEAPVVAAPAPIRSNLANNQEVATWVTGINARPLFSVTRRPDPGPSSPVAQADEPAKDLPRLAGVFTVGDVRQAVFQQLGDAPPQVVKEGDSVAGWKVEKISLQAVTLNGPSGETMLEPKFDETMVPPPPQSSTFAKGGGRPNQPPGQPPLPQAPLPQPVNNPRGAGTPGINPGTPIRAQPPAAQAAHPPNNASQPRAAPQIGGAQPPGVQR
jgi:hypothetical protein